MGTGAGTLLRGVAIAAAAWGMGCSPPLTKLPVTEVPLDQLQPTPAPPAGAEAPAATPVPIVEPDPTPTTPITTTTTPASSTPSTSRPGAAPAAIEASATAEEKVDASIKLLKSGRKSDLTAARRLLYTDVASGSGTPAEAKMLRNVCQRMNDKPCVAKATQYVK